MAAFNLSFTLLNLLLMFSSVSFAFPDEGNWKFDLSNEYGVAAASKSLFKDSQIFVNINCEPNITNSKVYVEWLLAESTCWVDYLPFISGVIARVYPIYGSITNFTHHINTTLQEYPCNGPLILKSEKSVTVPKQGGFSDKSKRGAQDSPSENTAILPVDDEDSSKPNVKKLKNPHKTGQPDPIYTIKQDGMYLFTLHIRSDMPFNAKVKIEMEGRYGFLSAAAWPLLPFYGVMCIVYVVYGVAWLVVSFSQWRDLLRIQFWIGGVILLGMLEKAVFYAEYQSINSTGESVKGAMLSAEIVSCAKRTLARMLVVIVSLGFGIVKPRLGAMLHRVVSAGILYFLLASIESYNRIMSPKNDFSHQILLASVPLALLDSAFCWWIFSNLVQTMRTLQLRRNLVKYSLYRHFSNALYCSVIASVCFMLYSIKYHRLTTCVEDWKDLWVDEAYWHILFSILLLVIMILWRPTNNNQRYAFTPLLDNPEDEDEEEEDQFVSDAFGLKMRGNNRAASPKPKSSTSVEDDLKWVEENIPAALSDTPLPVLDSDEEKVNTRFEVSKMQ